MQRCAELEVEAQAGPYTCYMFLLHFLAMSQN